MQQRIEKLIGRISCLWPIPWRPTTGRSGRLLRPWRAFHRSIRRGRFYLWCWMGRGIWRSGCYSLSTLATEREFSRIYERLWEEQPLDRGDCRELRALFSHPSYKAYCRVLRVSRVEVLRKLESQDDFSEVLRLQGRLKEISILERLPAEIEALEEALVSSDRYLRMEDNSARGNSRETARSVGGAANGVK